MVEIKQVSYNGWPNCFKMTNGEIELIALADVGPRIISFKFAGETNQFAEFSEHAGLMLGNEWRIYGGHRLWHAPEARHRTYYPDNYPVEVSIFGGRLLLKQQEEPAAKIQKSIEIEMDEKSGAVNVRHSIKNCGQWNIKLSAWAISAMAPGGLSILKQGHRCSENIYTPDLRINVWPLTTINDSRVKWGSKYILLRQDPEVMKKFKIGVSTDAGWVAYANNGALFIKYFDYNKTSEYPDFGSTVELYTDERIAEIETLSPLVEIAPEEEIVHTEKWELIRMQHCLEGLVNESVLDDYIATLFE